MMQSERKSHLKKQGKTKFTCMDTERTYRQPSEQLFPNRWLFGHLDLTKCNTNNIKGVNSTKIQHKSINNKGFRCQ